MQIVSNLIVQIIILIRELLFVSIRPNLWRFYLFFQFEYFFFSPYYYADKQADDDFIFGYTPLFTYNKIIKTIIKAMNIKALGKKYCDCGFGDGRGLFLYSLLYGINSSGFELNKKLAAKTCSLNQLLGVPVETIINGSFLNYSFSEYDIIFIAWTTFKDATVDNFVKKLVQEVKKGTVVVTLSFPIDNDGFKLIKNHWKFFSWGRSMVYYQYKI